MDWQPIETAPKDGTKILLYAVIWPDVAVGSWDESNNGWMLYPDSEDSGRERNISHWMPLPEPPKNV